MRMNKIMIEELLKMGNSLILCKMAEVIILIGT